MAVKVISSMDKEYEYFNHERLVRDVFKGLTEFDNKVVEICDCEPSKRVYLIVDGDDSKDYTIRYFISRCSEKSWSCEWTLFLNGNVIKEGKTLQIKYKN